MQAQDLDIGDPQPPPLRDGHDFRQRGTIAAGEDVFANPRIGRAGPVHAADRVQQRNPVRLQQRIQLVEEHAVLIDADMLEHANRDDAVILAAFLAIVAQMKVHAVGEAGRSGAALRHFELFLRQGQSGHLGAAFAGEIECEPAPARADVEHLLPRAQQQLGRDMPLLVGLRCLEVVLRRLEIGAGILAVAVEEQFVELVGQIVMVLDVAPRAVNRVVLMDRAENPARDIAEPHQAAAG